MEDEPINQNTIVNSPSIMFLLSSSYFFLFLNIYFSYSLSELNNKEIAWELVFLLECGPEFPAFINCGGDPLWLVCAGFPWTPRRGSTNFSLWSESEYWAYYFCCYSESFNIFKPFPPKSSPPSHRLTWLLSGGLLKDALRYRILVQFPSWTFILSE